MTQHKLPRGLRNNNPLNLRISLVSWVGSVNVNSDGEFEQFISIDYGIRAAIKTLHTYIKKGYNTPEKIITRWAPPVENNTSAYIKRACALADLSPSQVIERKSRNAICRLLWAMANIENGRTLDVNLFFSAYDKFFGKGNE